MRKLLFTFFLFVFSASAFAQGQDVLGLFMKDGTSVYFLLEEKPNITFVNEDVKVVSASNEATVKRTLIDRFEFVAEIPTGIEDVEEGEENAVRDRFELTGNAVCVSGLLSGCRVQLFSLNGQVIMSAVAGDNGCVTLSLETLPAGIYLVNYNETTIKFIKR